jgi:hypothetical protein
MQSESQALHALLSHLPPGPWHARGNKVVAGETVVGYFVCRQAAFVANQMARLPDLLVAQTEEVAALQTRITELETKLAEFEEADEDYGDDESVPF